MLGLKLHGIFMTASLMDNIIIKLVLYPELQNQVHIVIPHVSCFLSEICLHCPLLKKLNYSCCCLIM